MRGFYCHFVLMAVGCNHRIQVIRFVSRMKKIHEKLIFTIFTKLQIIYSLKFEQPSSASKTAFCVETKRDFKNYSYDQFFVEILREYYDSVTHLTKIEFEAKLKLLKRKRCLWEKCVYTSNTYCNNKGCEKYACTDHLLIICDTCFYDCVLKRKVYHFLTRIIFFLNN